MANLTCKKCGKSMDEKQFYTYRDGTKTELCKKCLTMHVDSFNPETFLWLLEKMDVPYIESAWNELRDKIYERDPFKMNGTSVFGKYLSKMKLNQWKDKRWADTEELAKEDEERKKELEKEEKRIKQDFSEGKISESEYKTLISTNTRREDSAGEIPEDIKNLDSFYNENDFMKEEELIDFEKELTKEDKMMLALKWGRLYKPNQWVSLEKKYKEMTESFDIQDSDTESTLILICKTYLKMNEAIDCGDLDGYQKLSRVFDSLRKSAKFTAAQNKDEKNNFVDSVGELATLCEREGGFIPRFCTDIPQDKVDYTLQDMNNYIYKLVTQDLGFGRQIEDALRKIQIQKEMEEEDLIPEEEKQGIKDEDYIDYLEDIEKQKEDDEKIYIQEEES